ncbi:conserved hypothetical protein [Echinococcus multilocularis]|uniref:F-box domain-containing protein n=1 Tax=Echinococcus multilocularis TaxID=6211 RepID=A0A068Y1B1_ECHMU|nr:conserved hypothetical protein [Echinococcus multilocularis]
MLEKLPTILQIEICKHLNGADLINLCEAMPNMKWVLDSVIFKGTLRNYLRQMEWVDATLHHMLYSTLSKMKAGANADSEVEAESEAEVLCKAIRYYQQDCQYRAKCLKQDLSNHNRVIHFMVLGRTMIDLGLLVPFMNTLRDWNYKCGERLYQNCSLGGGVRGTVARISNFDIHFNINNLIEEGDQHQKNLRIPIIRQFDGLVYVIDSTTQCHARRGLPRGLKYLMTNIASGVTLRPLVLLILDTLIGRTSGQADCLAANLHTLDDGAFRGSTQSPASATPCNWWRVWRLHQKDGKLVNLYEAFQWAAWQIAATSAESSSPGQSTQSE